MPLVRSLTKLPEKVATRLPILVLFFRLYYRYLVKEEVQICKRRRTFLEGQENDPMSGLANLIDVMLVFCVGLMIALVLSWNLQHILFVDIERGQQLKEVPQIQQSGGEGYQEMGKVFQDPETGKLILKEEVPRN